MAYDLGIIIPVYRSRESVVKLVQRLEALFLPNVKIRIALVDDSHDPETADYLEQHCMGPEVTLWVLDDNYGQQAAVLCGLENLEPCRYYATMDDDLEHPPEHLAEMYELIQCGYDLIYAVTGQRGHPFCRRVGSYLRDRLFSGILGTPWEIKVSSFRIMTEQVAKEACSMKRNGFFNLSAAIFAASRKNKTVLKVKNTHYIRTPRYQGKSGYRLSALIRLYRNILWHYYLKNRQLGAGKVYHIKNKVKLPKLMILGGSNCQIHAMERAVSLGIDTVLVDNTENPPAAVLAGIHEQVSMFDIQACIKAAQAYGVTGVLTLGTDQPVCTAACVSFFCDLPTLLSMDQALHVANKKCMKQILAKAGIPTAPWRLVDEDSMVMDLAALRSPYVIKPLDSQGQGGIFKLQTPGQVLGHLFRTLSYSKCEEALVEEFYESDEVTVSGWIKDGHLEILTVTDRLPYPDPVHIEVCIGHRFPSVHINRYDEITELSRRIVTAFELKQGPFYLQLLIGSEGIWVNELVSRIGGAFEDVFIPYITGFDLLQAVLDSAMGKEVSTEVLASYRAEDSKSRIAVQLLFCRPGEIGKITPLEMIKSLPYILDAGYNYEPGQTVSVMENATARFGHAVICGTEADITECVNDFYSHMSVTSTEEEELLCRYYPMDPAEKRESET